MLPLLTQIRIEQLVPTEILKSNTQCPGIEPIFKAKKDKITLTNPQIEDFNLIYYKLQTGSITEEEAILQLRGGGLDEVLFWLVVFIIISLNRRDQIEALNPQYADPGGWLSGK